MSAKERTQDELQASVRKWVDKKFNLPRKRKLREALFQGDWSFELVVNKVRHPEELDHIAEQGVTVRHLGDIISQLERDRFMIQSAAGADLVDLVKLEGGSDSA